MIDCDRFDECASPICFKDKNSLENGYWFPGEAVCFKRGCTWTKRQNKITKAGATFENGFFTAEMLKRKPRATPTIKGIDPSKSNYKELIEKWLIEHPVKKEIEYTPEQRAEFKNRMLSIKENL